MKAYRGDDDAIRLFRPDLNAKRMTSSLQRLAMPTFDETAFVELLKRFVEVEQDWVPRGEGHSMYLRPTCVATDPFLGVGVPQEATLYVCAPVGPYFPVRGRRRWVCSKAWRVIGFRRRLQAHHGRRRYGRPSRSSPKGVARRRRRHENRGNYAPTIKPVLDAAAQTDGRAQQVLFLPGDDHRVTEVGSMNVFVVMRTASGQVELVTAPLSGDILPGVTRRSILDLARADPASVGVDVVSERVFTMPEVVAASRDGRLLEVFGAGTAAVVCPVRGSSTRVRPSTCPPAAARARRERALAAPLGRALRTGRVRLGRGLAALHYRHQHRSSAPGLLLYYALREKCCSRAPRPPRRPTRRNRATTPTVPRPPRRHHHTRGTCRRSTCSRPRCTRVSTRSGRFFRAASTAAAQVAMSLTPRSFSRTSISARFTMRRLPHFSSSESVKRGQFMYVSKCESPNPSTACWQPAKGDSALKVARYKRRENRRSCTARRPGGTTTSR